MDSTPNGPNPKWTQPRMDSTLNELSRECTQLRRDSTPKGLNPEWTQPRKDSIPTGTQPQMDSTPKVTQPSNLSQPRMAQFLLQPFFIHETMYKTLKNVF